jgi:hypothetical protein
MEIIMYKKKRICVVVPCYNEETQITNVVITMSAIMEPVVADRVDYSKANRLFNCKMFNHKIPVARYFGNSILSLMVKVASEYWHVADSQTGYTAINLKIWKLINWDKSWKQFGCLNDYLIRLDIVNAKVVHIPIQPIYRAGEQSKMKIHKMISRLLYLFTKLFFYRMFHKYIINNSHPSIPFYGFGRSLGVVTIVLLIRMLAIYPINALARFFAAIACLTLLCNVV